MSIPWGSAPVHTCASTLHVRDCDVAEPTEPWVNESTLRRPMGTGTLAILGSLLLSFLAWLLIIPKPRNQRRRQCVPPGSVSVISGPINERRTAFLARAGDRYGYRMAACGYIDQWRSREFPSLIPPMAATTRQSLDPESKSGLVEPLLEDQGMHQDDSMQRIVYLDYAGAGLPSRRQLEAMLQQDLRMVSANPHSTGPAAGQTLQLLESARKRVLDHFVSHEDHQTLPQERYLAVFTSGATEALSVVAAWFPWYRPHQEGSTDCIGPVDRRSSDCSCRHSLLLYPHNAHTSVIGMRGPAMNSGADFVCVGSEECCASVLDAQLRRMDATVASCPHCCRLSTDATTHHLVVLTPECNATGDRLQNLGRTTKMLRELSSDRHHVTILMDVSKAASTGPVYVNQWDADLACVSFYKLFGAPTGVGCLLVKRSCAERLFVRRSSSSHPTEQVRRYFGGGSVDIVVPADDYTVLRSEPLPALVHGTCHFRGIASLVHGFDDLDRLGGMATIRDHCMSLASELVRRLLEVKHADGNSVVEFYGNWKMSQANEISDLSETLGPTVAFNILRQDGSYVGYNEVSKLAALNDPPIQIRTGCFCNPGACQDALQLTSKDMIYNFETAGHVCGDQVDIVNGRPTGAVRVSFGKESFWEDLDAFVSFVQRVFVSQTLREESCTKWDGQPRNVTVDELYVFPIKSCAAQRVKRWKLSHGGRLAYDREFTLVDSAGIAMRLQSFPKMALIQPELDLTSMTLRVTAPGCTELVLDLSEAEPLSDEPHHDS